MCQECRACSTREASSVFAASWVRPFCIDIPAGVMWNTVECKAVRLHYIRPFINSLENCQYAPSARLFGGVKTTLKNEFCPAECTMSSRMKPANGATINKWTTRTSRGHVTASLAATGAPRHENPRNLHPSFSHEIDIFLVFYRCSSVARFLKNSCMRYSYLLVLLFLFSISYSEQANTRVGLEAHVMSGIQLRNVIIYRFRLSFSQTIVFVS